MKELIERVAAGFLEDLEDVVGAGETDAPRTLWSSSPISFSIDCPDDGFEAGETAGFFPAVRPFMESFRPPDDVDFTLTAEVCCDF